MTVTAVETSTDVLKPGDMVRVADDATDGQGYGSGTLRGKTGRLDFLDSYSGWFVRSEDNKVGVYVAARFLTRVTEESAEVGILRDEFTALKVKLETAESNARTARTALFTFQAKVQQAMTEASEEENDDDTTELLNGILYTLNLDRITREFEIEITVRGSYKTTVMAANKDDARGLIDQSEIADYLRDGGVDMNYFIDDFDIEVQ